MMIIISDSVWRECFGESVFYSDGCWFFFICFFLFFFRIFVVIILLTIE